MSHLSHASRSKCKRCGQRIKGHVCPVAWPKAELMRTKPLTISRLANQMSVRAEVVPPVKKVQPVNVIAQEIKMSPKNPPEPALSLPKPVAPPSPSPKSSLAAPQRARALNDWHRNAGSEESDTPDEREDTESMDTDDEGCMEETGYSSGDAPAAVPELLLAQEPPLIPQMMLAPSFDTDAEDSVSIQPLRVLTNGEQQHHKNMERRQWSEEEDALLTEAVERFGMRRWAHIATFVTGRAGKQCRERWVNHLRPGVKHQAGPSRDIWTEEEDRLIAAGVIELGTKWSEIAKRVPGRSDNAIKNRYNSEIRKERRKQAREERSAALLLAAGAEEKAARARKKELKAFSAKAAALGYSAGGAAGSPRPSARGDTPTAMRGAVAAGDRRRKRPRA